MGTNLTLLWLRQDLRLGDQPALAAALSRRDRVVPVYIWAPEEEDAWPPGRASRRWLHASLGQLDASLRSRGSRLVIRRGPTLATLRGLAAETRATTVAWNRRYEPASVNRDAAVEMALYRDGLRAETHSASLLVEPEALRTKSGGIYKVFTPFWNAWRQLPEPASPSRTPRSIAGPSRWPKSLELSELGLAPDGPSDALSLQGWEPGERGAYRRLRAFVRSALGDYARGRDVAASDGTSRLSPHLHFGEIGPRQIWHSVRAAARGARGSRREAAQVFLREIAWREFAYHLLCHNPFTPGEPLRSEFLRFQWRDDEDALQAWKLGETGYPIVDAAMRSLAATGWMHNRLRMIVGSFLVKDLMVPWQEGARWFWETLVDADLASNTLGWQWVAGCGADAAPYFRVFNPVLQGRRHDPDAAYVHRWIPDLAGLGPRETHAPWTAGEKNLQRAGIHLGEDYPYPIVDHAAARKRALAAYKRLRRG